MSTPPRFDGNGRGRLTDDPILGPSARLSTIDDWEGFALAPRSRAPQLPSPAEWRRMSPRERAAFDQLRFDHHANFGPIVTSQFRRIQTALHLQLMANLEVRLPGPRLGSIIDGEGGRGKSTILREFGRLAWRTLRRRHLGAMTPSDDLFIPVVHISLAANTTIKAFDRHVLEFCGIPSRRGATIPELSMIVRKVARRCGTVLFLIDDVHFLPMHSDAGKQVNDHLKYLATETAATFVYAGIECEAGGLLNEGKRHGKAVSQTSSRFSRHPVLPFSLDTAEGKREWRSFLMAAEGQIRLFGARPGMLSATLMAQYIFKRTNGEMVATMALIRGGAHIAMLTEKERIVEPLLDEIVLDHHAESGAQQRRGSILPATTYDLRRVSKAIARTVHKRVSK